MVNVNSISKSYDGNPILKNVSFDLPAGEVLGILGPNGAGKTTLLKILASYHFPDSGNVEIDGYSVIHNSIRTKSICGYLSEKAPLYENMKVIDFIQFNAASKVNGKKNIKLEVDKLIKNCYLDQYKNTLISKLSSGYRQRCAIAGALAGDLSLLILDEPGKGLDPGQIIELRNIIKNRDPDVSVIISSHILSEIEILCDRFLILDNGILKSVNQSSFISYNVVIQGDSDLIDSLSNEKDFTVISRNELKSGVFEMEIEISRKNHEISGGALIYDQICKRKLRLYYLEAEKNILEKNYMETLRAKYE